MGTSIEKALVKNLTCDILEHNNLQLPTHSVIPAKRATVQDTPNSAVTFFHEISTS